MGFGKAQSVRSLARRFLAEPFEGITGGFMINVPIALRCPKALLVSVSAERFPCILHPE